MDYQLHKPSTGRSVNPYTDKYTGFIWNEHHSSDFNCFIENTGHLTFEPAPEFSNSMVSPAFYDGSLFTGTQTQSKKVQLNLVFYHITLADFNRALKWLDYKKVGSLLFDYSDEWRYQCKLSSLGVTEKYVDGYCVNTETYKKQDLYICRVQAVFETVDIHNAIETYGEVRVKQPPLTNGQLAYAAGTFPALYLHNIIPAQYITDQPFLIINGQEYQLPIGVSNLRCNFIDNSTLSVVCKVTQLTKYFIIDIMTGTYNNNSFSKGSLSVVYYTFYDIDPLTLSNPNSLPISFRVHFFNFTTPQFVLYLGKEEETRIPICSVDLNLDVGGAASLHYNSKSGAVTMGDQLINQVTNGNGDIVAKYCNSLSQITIPPYSEITLTVSDGYNGEIMIDYDLQESVL